MLLEKLLAFDGALLMVSHDRDLLDKVCNRILEIEDGHIKLYQGNYSDYKEQKDLEIKTNELEYENYIKERRKLERSIIETKSKAKGMRKTPKRMGNSEARLHKMASKMPGEVWIKKQRLWKPGWKN